MIDAVCMLRLAWEGQKEDGGANGGLSIQKLHYDGRRLLCRPICLCEKVKGVASSSFRGDLDADGFRTTN